jgi:hypothetical protein
MGKYEGVGERIRERLLALGYVKPNGDTDVQEFCWRHRFGTTHLYAWVGDKMTPFKDLTRLCDALNCSEKWLLTGEEREIKKAAPARSRPRIKSLWLALPLAAGALLSPSGSVSAQGRALYVPQIINEFPLLGSWRRFRKSSGYLALSFYRKRRSFLSLGTVPA